MCLENVEFFNSDEIEITSLGEFITNVNSSVENKITFLFDLLKETKHKRNTETLDDQIDININRKQNQIVSTAKIIRFIKFSIKQNKLTMTDPF